ncbi:MAG: LacI family transcriptional regulator [Actinomycetota bacterium]|nr:LacI family transcriptional regulator [Actinomycetota bacterium]MDP9493754.1 LacI family transcriptional regulator [Actinomycetota bacterium]
MLESSHRVTIKDVAARSGVSTQTVSRVINNRPDVASDTRQRVEGVIATLGYRPSAVARTLVARRSHSIGVLLAGMGYTGTALTLRGIIDESASLGLTVLIAELPEGDSLDDPRSAISALVEHHVDGIIMSVPAIGQAVDRIKAVLSDHHAPVVFVKAGVSDRYSSVLIDNAAAVEEVVDHLVSIGRSRIAHISGPANWHEARDRREGWERGLEKHHLEVDPGLCEEGDWSPSSGAVAMSALLDRVPDLDAVVAANDRMALGAMHVLQGRQLRIPEDVAITGFDDVEEAAWFAPPLTSVGQPLTEMGRQAVRRLWSEFEGTATPHVVMPLRADLMIRESTIGAAQSGPE